jgi:hypothetical protein
MDTTPEVITISDDEIEQNARRTALLRINPHFYYDEKDRYNMQALVVPAGRWITLELGVRSFGWEKVERSPDLQRMLNQVGFASCEYVNETVIKPAHAGDSQ